MTVDQIVIRVKELAIGKLPKCYGENGDNIWEAFHLGEKYAALEQQKGVAPAPNKPQPEICPHFVSDRIQVGENYFERVDTCTCHGKLSGVR